MSIVASRIAEDYSINHGSAPPPRSLNILRRPMPCTTSHMMERTDHFIVGDLGSPHNDLCGYLKTAISTTLCLTAARITPRVGPAPGQ